MNLTCLVIEALIFKTNKTMKLKKALIFKTNKTMNFKSNMLGKNNRVSQIKFFAILNLFFLDMFRNSGFKG
jgi:hypothetical protein